MENEIELPIGIPDSELLGYERKGDGLNVRVRCWNARTLVIRFGDVLGVRELLAGDFSLAVRAATASQSFLQEALVRLFVTVPPDHGYEVYSFFNNDDEPSLEVVARSFQATVEEDQPTPGGRGVGGSTIGRK